MSGRNGVECDGRRVAFLLSPAFDDWLDSLHLDIDEFCDQMVGSWVFNCVKALGEIGIVSMIVVPTSRFSRPAVRIHKPTSARILFLPKRVEGSGFRILSRALNWIPYMKSLGASLLEATSIRGSALADLLRREQCEALIVQEYESGSFDRSVWVGKRLSIPVVGRCTGAMPRGRSVTPLRMLSLKHSSGVLVTSRAEREQLKRDYRMPDKKLLHLFYPIDRSAWYPEDRLRARAKLGLPTDRTIALYHGAIEMSYKGIDILLDGWERAVDKSSSCQLLIVGEGGDADQLKKRIALSGRTDILFRNEWLHDRDELRAYLSAANLYVFPTRGDVLPLAMAEAMACGLPILTASARGVPDMFPDGEESGAVVVPVGDTSEFARQLRQLLRDESLRDRLGSRALERIADSCFTSAQFAGRLAEFLFPPGVSAWNPTVSG